MDHWTPADRNSFIMEAVNEPLRTRGYKGTYQYSVMPKLEGGVDNEDPRRTAVTETLSETLYVPKNKHIVLNLYYLICQKLMTHQYIGHEFNRNFVVLLKGSNAHVYLAKMHGLGGAAAFKNADTDIIVVINPYLSPDVFYNIKYQVEIVVKQVLSQYKRSLDHALFLDSPFDSMINQEVAEEFKKEFTMNLTEIEVENAQLKSPFESNVIRNKCSRNSFFITPSQAQENSVVLIEVPHFDKCEKIPLRKTPLFCSFNESIDFKRDGPGGTKIGKFNLYRLKLNVLCECFDSTGKLVKEEKIPSDFVDVSVPDMTDVELHYFWSRGRSMSVYDEDVNMWVAIPDLYTVVMEIKRILTEYESNEAKKAKRMAKLSMLERFL
jgi:hypothetical protein